MAEERSKSTSRSAGESFGAAIRKSIGAGVANAGQAVAGQFPVLSAILGPLATQGGRIAARDFVEGVAGIPATPAVAVRPAAPATQAQAVAQALDTGRQAAPTITPQDRAMTAIEDILSRPHTLQEFQAATGALPGVAASIKPVQSRKDIALGTVLDANAALYASEAAAAKTDEEKLQALERARSRTLEALGIDPSKQAMAALLQQAQQDQE